MRNLKKVLSMALAVVMLFGMMTFASAADAKIKATDLTDFGSVVNKDAVQLLVDLGVVAGIKQADGTYKYEATTNINRASYAKMIYYVQMGTADASGFKGSSVLKDTAGHWAEGFINYCASVKIVAGDDQSFFHPDNDVSVVEAAKMLLVALGYVALDRGYEMDANWSLNIMRDATDKGLMKNVTQTATDKLNRDNAAQMIFNALGAVTEMAQYGRDNGEKYVTGYTKGDTLGFKTYSMVKLSGVVTAIDAKGNATIAGAAYISNKLAGTPDMLGNSVVAYVKADKITSGAGVVSYTPTSLVSTALAVGDSKIIATSTDGVKLVVSPFTSGTSKDLTTKDSKNKGYIAELNKGDNGTFEWTDISVFGFNATADLDVGDMTKLNAAIVKGAVVQLISTDDDGDIDVIKVFIKTPVKLTGDVKVEKNSDNETIITVPGISTINQLDAADVVGYEGLKKDDFVLYYKANDVFYIEKATSVTGKVTGTNSDNEITVGGKNYAQTGLAWAAGTGLTAWAATSTEYEFFLDNGGYVIGNKVVGEETAAKYAILLATGWYGSTTEIGATSGAQAKLFFADGTTEVVKISKNGGVKVTDSAAWTGLGASFKNVFYTYKTDKDGKYELTIVAPGDGITTPAAISNKAVLDNTAKFVTDNALIANTKTVFLLAKGVGDDTTYSAVTGYAKLPAMPASASVSVNGSPTTVNTVVTALVKENACTYVYITAAKFTGDTEKLPIVYFKAEAPAFTAVYNADSELDYYVFKGVVDGKKDTEIKVDDSYKSAFVTAVTAGGFFSLTTTDGLVTTAAVVANEATGVTKVVAGASALGTSTNNTFSLKNGVIVLESDAYTYDSATKIYLVDNSGATMNASVLAADAFTIGTNVYTVIVVLAEKDKPLAESVYILRTAVTDTGV